MTTHQCVIAILSGPLKITLAPPGPAIFASRDCAHVTVMVGREDDGSDRGGRYRTRKGGARFDMIAVS